MRQSLMSETGDFQETFNEMLEETLDPDVTNFDFSCFSQNFVTIDYDYSCVIDECSIFSKMAK